MVERPNDREVRLGLKLLAPLERIARPVFLEMDKLPKARPLLFVGNHTLYGMLDVPFLYAELYARHGIRLRALGDHIHFRIPVWRAFLTRFGAVDGTRAECARLMAAGEAVLVFPGGAREVSKRRGERYALVWKERLGFCRMAIEHDATIVPFAAVGVDDAFDVVFDADDIAATPIGAMLRALGLRSEVVLPLAVPSGRPERLYFRLGTPLRARDFTEDAGDDVAVRRLRDEVKASVEAGITTLRTMQREDPDRHAAARKLPRWLSRNVPRPLARNPA